MAAEGLDRVNSQAIPYIHAKHNEDILSGGVRTRSKKCKEVTIVNFWRGNNSFDLLGLCNLRICPFLENLDI